MLDQGCMAEFDMPAALLADMLSWFYLMVLEVGLVQDGDIIRGRERRHE